MQKFLGLLLALCAVVFALGDPWQTSSLSPAVAGTIAPPCGTPIYTPFPGAPVVSSPMANELMHLESCAASAAASPVASPPITIGAGFPFPVGIANGACLGVVANLEAYTCPTPGPQATPSPTPTFGTLVTGAWPYTVGLDQTINANWTEEHVWAPNDNNNPPITIEPTSTASPAPCPTALAATPAPQGVLCIGPYAGGSAATTAVGGIVIGKTAGNQWGTTTTANSAPLQFVRNNGTTDSIAYIYYASGGTFFLGQGAPNIGVQAPTAVAGTLQVQESSVATKSYVPPIYTSAGAIVNANYHGSQFTCTFSASTTCTTAAWTGAAVFTATADIIGCAVASSTTAVVFSASPASATTITLTGSASNSQTVTGVCWGF